MPGARDWGLGMSVLKLRRDMVVADEESAVEISTPFPLRKIEQAAIEAEVTEIEVEVEEDAPEPSAHKQKTFFGVVRFWMNIAAAVVVVAAYPAMMIAASNVGDHNVSSVVDRTRWTSPWAGGVAMLMEKNFNELGWAPDAESWTPMARLTAKPAFQSAMAGSLGEFVTLSQAQLASAGLDDQDLTAASRLISATATGAQLRAARDALISYDRRLKRRSATIASTPMQIGEQLTLINSWAGKSQTELAAAAQATDGNPFNTPATLAVYAAKGRGMAAYTVLDTLHWPDATRVARQRSAALAAWKDVAEFHPVFVLNGSPDGSLFGNHATSMGFLIGRAQKATDDFAAAVRTIQPAPPIIANAIAPGSFK
jgi:hypothetical protein